MFTRGSKRKGIGEDCIVKKERSRLLQKSYWHCCVLVVASCSFCSFQDKSLCHDNYLFTHVRAALNASVHLLLVSLYHQ